MSARGKMTMRATVARNTNTAKNVRGRPAAPTFGEIGIIPCWAWSVQRRDADDSSKDAVIEDMRALVPAAADVVKGDQLVITDRSGLLQFEGPVLVLAGVPRRGSGSRAVHATIMLRRHL
jgi:hypothetical protein